jgi:hypothetical protein
MGKGYGSMTADIIKGPWRKGRKIVIPDPNETIEIEEDLMFADNLTEQIMVQLIHTMSENGFDINNESFIRSMAFVIETLKASIYKELELEHPMSSLMDIVSKVTLDKDNRMQGSIDPKVLYELSEQIDEPDPEIS